MVNERKDRLKISTVNARETSPCIRARLYSVLVTDSEIGERLRDKIRMSLSNSLTPRSVIGRRFPLFFVDFKSVFVLSIWQGEDEKGK